MDGREMCRTWLNEKALFLDTETTGLDNRAEVVEIAIADSKGRPVFESLVKPTVPITPRLTDIHGISNAMVADAPSWAEIHADVNEIMCGKTVIAYNSNFDARIIEQTVGLHSLPGIFCYWECAMQMYQNHTGFYKWVKLVDAAEQCGVSPNGQTHRAMTDVMMTWEIVQKIASGNRYTLCCS